MIEGRERERVVAATDAFAALLVAGDRPAAERALDALRELAWHRRAAEIRGRRHAGPGTRGAVLGRAVVRRKPRMRGAEALDLIRADRHFDGRCF